MRNVPLYVILSGAAGEVERSEREQQNVNRSLDYARDDKIAVILRP